MATVQLRLENDGNVEIRSIDYERPVTIVFPPGTTVIDASVLESEPGDLGLNMTWQDNRATLSTNLLNPKDRAIFRFIVVEPSQRWIEIQADERIVGLSDPALIYLASLAPGSQRTMRQALDVIADALTAGLCDHVSMPWAALRFQHTQAVRAVLMQRYSPKTANKILSALKQTLRTAWNLGLLTAEEYQRAVALKPVSGEQPDAAILALLRVGGLHRSEVAGLQLADYNKTTQAMSIRGKRNRVRILPIEDRGALEALSD